MPNKFNSGVEALSAEYFNQKAEILRKYEKKARMLRKEQNQEEEALLREFNNRVDVLRKA